MKLTLDLESLHSKALDPNTYCFLYLQFIGEVAKSWQLSPISEVELLLLENNEYIKILEDNGVNIKEVSLRKKALDLFEDNEAEKKWLEFKSHFPVKSGERRLHDVVDKCRDKYISKLSKEHANIMKGLDNEMTARYIAARKNQFFPAWQFMSVYLNKRRWEMYLDYIPTEDVSERFKSI